MLGGYVNRIGRVDLSKGEVSYEGIKEEDARNYIGGRGLGIKFLFDNGPKVEPFSEDNILCIMTGPLTGTAAPMSGRLAFVTKSPLTGTCVDSHMGGWSGARLKWAGFDGLIFKGRSEKPVYAYVERGRVELKDASHLWGKGVHEVVKILKDEHGDVSVMAMGLAGENKVRFANFINEDNRAAGRGGTGAIGGDKKLKAIVIKAKEEVPKPKDEKAFGEAREKALKAITESEVTAPGKGGLSVYGTDVLMNLINEVKALPTRNAQATSFEHANQIGGEALRERILVKEPTCYGCPVACKREVEVKEGKFKTHMESVEYESA